MREGHTQVASARLRPRLELALSFVLGFLLAGDLQAMSRREVRVFETPAGAFVPLRDLADVHHFEYRETDRSILLTGQYASFRFLKDSRRADFDGVAVWLHEPVQRFRRRWVIRHEDVQFAFDPFLRANEVLAGVGNARVMLDPGHGGKDKGTGGAAGSQEKTLVLDLVRRLRVHLVNAGVKTLVTRDADKYLELADRAASAGRESADLFVSVHLNSAANPEARGAETYVLAVPGMLSTADQDGRQADVTRFPGHDHLDASFLLATHVQRRLQNGNREEDRGVRRARFVVLREARCPAVLVECGFLSNREEEARFNDPVFREETATRLSRGILEYLKAVQQARSLAETSGQ